MAYTQSPTQDSHKIQRINTRGSPFVVTNDTSNVPVTLQYVECFPLSEKQWGDDTRYSIHKREPWINTVRTVTGSVNTSTNICRSTAFGEDYDTIFFAIGDTYYYYNYNGGTVTSYATNSTAFISSFTSAIDNSNARRICALGFGGILKTCLEDGSSVTSTDLSALSLLGSRGLVFIDGYLFAVNSGGDKIYNSAAGGVLTTWNATDFLNAEQYSDPVWWIDKHKNYLVAFGSQSIEFFYDAGNEVGSPLTRQESYSTRIGITEGAPGKIVANIEDTLYFIGKSRQNNHSLYKIENFQVSEIDSQYMQNVFNFLSAADPTFSVHIDSVETVIINNNPMIRCVFYDTAAAYYSMVYFPKEDIWWQMLTSADGSGTNFPGTQAQIGQCFVADTFEKPLILAKYPDKNGTAVRFWEADQAHATSCTAYFYTGVEDLGTNRWKHIARMDAIGDYGNNVLTLSYNFTPNYDQTYTSAGSVTPSTIGYGSNISWYNLGAYRRGSFKLSMTGTDNAIHQAFEMEANVGVS